MFTLQKLKELGNSWIFWHSFQEPYFSSIGEFKDVVISIMATLAKIESRRISERTKEGIYRARIRGKTLGRPRGSKDKQKRRKAGYYLREARKKQQEAQKMGMPKSIENYLNNEKP